MAGKMFIPITILRACLHGGGGPQVGGDVYNPLWLGNPTVNTISHFNLITFT